MENNGILNKLKKVLDGIYSDFRSRIDAETWKNAILGSYRENPENTAVVVTDFMLSHRYVPAKVWRTVFYAIELREQPVKLSNIYSRAAVNEILDRMAGTDALRYGYIPATLSEETIRELMDTADEAVERLARGQIYLAEKAIEGIRAHCPTHPDLLDLQKQYAEVRSTGGVSAGAPEGSAHGAGDRRFEDYLTLTEPEELRKAAKVLEQLIEEDYHVYGAYFPLGIVYLKQGETRKADWVANLLMDLGEAQADACVLKGLVLEEAQRPEDAFFYYDRACRKDPSSRRALEARRRLLKLLEPDCPENFLEPAAEAAVPEPLQEPSEVRRAAGETDHLIHRGRLTEAYYEIAKKTEEYPQSDLLRFKKAMALYLMRKEPEARAEFRLVKKDSPLWQNAEYLIYDLDRKITDQRKYDNILPPMLADIFFNIGNYAEALSVYGRIEDAEMSAAMWVQRGRCELAQGKLKNALSSFTNGLGRDPHVDQARELTGLLLQTAGDNEHALEMFDDAIRMFPDRKNIWEFKASLLYSTQQNEELLRFRDLLENSRQQPSDVDGFAGLVLAVREPKNEARGLYCLERAMNAGTSDTAVYLAAANICIAREQYFRAMLAVEQGIRTAGSADPLYMKKSEILYLSGDLESAFINTGILLTRNPESAELQYLMGCITSDRGSEKEGIRWFRSAAQLDPSCHKYAFAVADKCFETEDMSGALTYYSKAIALDPRDSASLKRRALLYSLRDEKEKAVNDIQKAIELRPEDPEVYLIMGDILSSGNLPKNLDLEAGPLQKNPPAAEGSSEEEAQGSAPALTAGDQPEQAPDGQNGETESSEDRAEHGQQAEASACQDTENASVSEALPAKEKDAEYYYSRAIAMEPSSRQGYISRARYYTDVRRLDDALSDIQKAVQMDPEAGDSYMMRGLVHHVRGENEAAVQDFERAAQSEHLALQACSYLAKCRNAMQQYEAAIEAADRGLAMDGEFLNLYVNRGVALFHLERYYQAIEDFKRVIQKKNEVNTAAVEAAYRFRGMTNELLGNMDAALGDYRMLMKYNPDYPEIRVKIQEMESLMKQNEKKHHFSFFKRKKRRED